MSTSIADAADLISQSEYVVAMTGAGMSVESGIPTFRGKDGLWTRYGQPPMDGFKRFREDPVGWWQKQVNRQMDAHMIELRDALVAARPHTGHHALSELEQLGALDHVITQNIDGLDQKAGLKNLIEIHGNRSRLRCIDCGARTALGDFVPREPPEPCHCGGAIKFDTVMFGEPIPNDTMLAARDQIDRATCVLAIGTSASVRPASGLLWIAKSQGATLIEINPFDTKLSSICDVVIRSQAGEALNELLRYIDTHSVDPLDQPEDSIGCTIHTNSKSAVQSQPAKR